ncbi:hypothetical protein LC1917_0049 [Lacticaseibacillus paracasei NRIC 1917]|uniref:Uncharacterized protein n=1 Tax=Lacticaseibacillus paracasei NRIC 0644 TaxID=1435038 RepID=A0A0C9PR72_LACPA|nr:hypothetical protein LC0644_2075 [Lacticaseibacillus paracasei NRIC 0644]GAN38172.1 hypothetical protein LC1917_0049 [Lacticaseibacillus paracasei NRIC 1917]
MIGDMILSAKEFFSQTFCIHDYLTKNREVGTQTFTIYECKKCGRSKVKGC